MEDLNLNEKFFIIHKTFYMLEQYFAHWNYIPGISLDGLRKKYVAKLFETRDRIEFDMLMLRMFSELKNSHTFYYDAYLNEKCGGKIGFYAFYHDKEKKFVVLNSVIKEIKIGDIILGINDEEIETFFKNASVFISASSEREARNRLFAIRYLFPERFHVRTNRGTFIINREQNPLPAWRDPKPEFRLL